MMVHDNKRLPVIQATGYYLMPERKHRLSVTARKQERLGDRYQKCEDNIPEGLQAVFDQLGTGDYIYDQSNCYAMCIQTYVYV